MLFPVGDEVPNSHGHRGIISTYRTGPVLAGKPKGSLGESSAGKFIILAAIQPSWPVAHVCFL